MRAICVGHLLSVTIKVLSTTTWWQFCAGFDRYSGRVLHWATALFLCFQSWGFLEATARDTYGTCFTITVSHPRNAKELIQWTTFDIGERETEDFPPFLSLGRQFWNVFYEIFRRFSGISTSCLYRRGPPCLNFSSCFPPALLHSCSLGSYPQINHMHLSLCLTLWFQGDPG